MKYSILIEADTELEAYRLDLIDELMKHTNKLKRVAEQVLGIKITSIKPVGDIMLEGVFDESQDIEVAFYTNSKTIVDTSMSALLQSHLAKIQIEGIGTICPIVYRT